MASKNRAIQDAKLLVSLALPNAANQVNTNAIDLSAVLPQLGGVHAVQVPPVQVVLPMQLPHCTLPLPHAFSIDPHFDPAPPSPPMHSGGGGLHTPPMHV